MSRTLCRAWIHLALIGALMLASVGAPVAAGADERTKWLERLAGRMQESAGVKTPFPCDDGWLANQTGYVVDVTPWAEGAGLRRGDRFLALGGAPVTDTVDWGDALAGAPTADSLEMRVDRAGQPVTVTLPCKDNRERSRAQREVLDAIVAGKWDECIGAARRLAEVTGRPFSVTLFFEWNCANEKLKAERPGERGPDDFWELYYQLQSRRLEDAKYFPGGLKERGPEILRAISVLEQQELRGLAASLRKQLFLAVPEPTP